MFHPRWAAYLREEDGRHPASFSTPSSTIKLTNAEVRREDGDSRLSVTPGLDFDALTAGCIRAPGAFGAVCRRPLLHPFEWYFGTVLGEIE